jgi:hypothetical protein
MSYYTITNDNMNNFNINNIIFGNKISSDDMSRYYLYYKNNNDACEIYINLPKIRMIYNNFLNQKYSKINIPIYPMWERPNAFIKFIEYFETTIIEAFNSKLTFHSLLSERKLLKLFKMSMKETPNIISSLGNNITFNDFKLNSEIELVVKISYVWFSKKTQLYGLSCHLSQIKYYGIPEQLKIEFIEDTKTQLTQVPPPPLLQPIEVYKKSLAKTSSEVNNIVKLVPSIADLTNALKKLKKI